MKKLLYLLLSFCVLASCELFKDTELPEEDPDEEMVIPVVSVSLSASDLNLYIDESVQLIATVKPRDATYKLKWWSESPETAKVDGEGLITALSVGTTDIYVQAGDQVASCFVTVSKPEFSEYIDEYGINHGQGVKIADVIWAPVNCGYHASDFKYGKLYQWGRKYGQGYDGDASEPTIEPGGMSEMGGNNKSHSNVFYKGVATDNNDWVYPSDDHLWNAGTDANPLKSEYDPCPVGWRVPTYAELADLCNVSFSWTTNPNGQEGRLFSDEGTSSELFLPASGCRSSSDGSANSQGIIGYYWSSRPNSPYSCNICFDAGSIDTSVDSYRAEGFSIRCVQDDDEYIPPLLEISESSLAMTANGGQKSIELTSNVDWTSDVDADWVSVAPSSGTASDTPVPIQINVSPNGGESSRTATITFTALGFTRSVAITQKGSSLELSESSLTIAAQGGQVTIEVKSNVDWSTKVNAHWVSVTPSLGYASDYPVSVNLTVAANQSPTSRSAIVEFYAGGITKMLEIYQHCAGDYIDEYGINHGQGVKIGETVWAPVNCGYHETDFKYGKLYQWGRKYGQGYDGDLSDGDWNIIGDYSDALIPELVGGPVSLATGQLKANENKFYDSSYPYDWLYPQDNQLWNSGTADNPVKTEYDPCPEGWRVPTYMELENLSQNYSSWLSQNDQNGRWFSGSESYSSSVPQVFFPAAGYRSCGGYAERRGNYGSYWSSRPHYGGGAYDLSFGSSGVSTDIGSYLGRAGGQSVRCVQE